MDTYTGYPAHGGYGGATTAASRFPTSETAAIKESTAAEQVIDRLRGLRDTAAALVSRVNTTADRATGGIPQPGATNGGPKASAPGAFGTMNDVIEEIAHLLNAAHDQVNRLERAV